MYYVTHKDHDDAWPNPVKGDYPHSLLPPENVSVWNMVAVR